MEWKDINNAPKDETEILAIIKSPSDEVKEWLDIHHAPCNQRFWVCVIRFWRNAWYITSREVYGTPIKWMPLPELPVNLTSDEQQ